MSWRAVEGSFRDPRGFVYTRDGTLFRQVNRSFSQHLEAFLASGLYDGFVRDTSILGHSIKGWFRHQAGAFHQRLARGHAAAVRGEDLRRLKDKACGENEVGCPMPVVDGLGTKKILTIVKPGR